MGYFEAKMLDGETVDTAVAKVTEALKAQGFGVLTTIDVKETLKAKIGADFRPYRILGACNPALAYQALQAEEHVGLMLPCNVVVQEKDGGAEVSAIDPVASMAAIDNPVLHGLAAEVGDRLRQVIRSL